MITVLVLTQPDDTHAIYVKKALEVKGHRCILWFTGDYPSQQTHTFVLDQRSIEWRSTGIDDQLNEHDIDVVWYRRPRKLLASSLLHPDDIENAENENTSFYQSLWQMLAENAVWINTLQGRQAGNCKLLQLKIASRVGLQYPPTLVSNNPDEIRRFISQNRQDNVIYKTLSPMMWFGKHDAWLAYARPIKLEQLPSDMLLQAVPGLFQKKIDKSHELRITYFGDKYIAVKIDSQNHPKAKQDWRYAPAHELALEAVTLPNEIDLKCKLLMKQLGIVFGCIDMIRTPDGEYVFLEVNEQGQFLWIEDVNSDILMLDTFTNFLIHQGMRRGPVDVHPIIRMNELSNEVEKFINEATQTHKGTVLLKPKKTGTN